MSSLRFFSGFHEKGISKQMCPVFSHSFRNASWWLDVSHTKNARQRQSCRTMQLQYDFHLIFSCSRSSTLPPLFLSSAVLMMSHGCVSEAGWKMSAKMWEIKPRRCFTWGSHLTWLTDWLHEFTLWDRKKSATASRLHTILCLFVMATGGAVSQKFHRVQNNLYNSTLTK